MNHTFSIPVDKLMFWQSGSWTKPEKELSNLTLRILPQMDHLMITTDIKIIENINMKGKIKGFFKDDVLILITSNAANEIRKLRLQIKSNLPECLQVLGQFFPMLSHGSPQSKNIISPRYKNIEEVFKTAIETMEGNGIIDPLPLPASYNNFVRLCLLDPTFPQLVHETQKILDEVLKK